MMRQPGSVAVWFALQYLNGQKHQYQYASPGPSPGQPKPGPLSGLGPGLQSFQAQAHKSLAQHITTCNQQALLIIGGGHQPSATPSSEVIISSLEQPSKSVESSTSIIRMVVGWWYLTINCQTSAAWAPFICEKPGPCTPNLAWNTWPNITTNIACSFFLFNILRTSCHAGLGTAMRSPVKKLETV